MLRELTRYVLDQSSTPLVIGVVLILVVLIGLVQRRYSRQVRELTASIKSRDERLAELEKKLYRSKLGDLQAKVGKLHPQPRRRVTAQQKALLEGYARVPEGRHFTIEIIHDMAGSDCRAYANDFRAVLKEIGWSISRSAVLRPGWVARCGRGVYVQNRDILSRPETVMLNALAAAGIDYDLVRIPDLDADIGLIVNPAPSDSVWLMDRKGCQR